MRYLLSEPLHETGIISFLPLCFLTCELLVKDAKVVKSEGIYFTQLCC